MDDSLFRCGFEAEAGIASGAKRFVPRQTAAPRELVCEAARQELHRREGDAVLLPGRVQADDVRMHEPGDELHLAEEALARLAAAVAPVENLERDRSGERVV